MKPRCAMPTFFSGEDRMEMNYPESVLKLAAEMAEKYANDINQATAEAERAVRNMPEFGELVAVLVRSAVRGLIYQARHTANVRLRQEAGGYGAAAKVNLAGSEAVGRACESWLVYCIGGTTLGMLKGADLKATAESERSIASGHLFNARLCEALAQIVPDDKQVIEVLTEKRLAGIVRRLQKDEDKAA